MTKPREEDLEPQTDEEQWQAYYQAQLELKDMPDDFLVMPAKASAFIGFAKSKKTLKNERSVGDGIPYKASGRSIFYTLGALRKFLADMPEYESTSNYNRPFGFVAMVALEPRDAPFWLDVSARKVIGPVFGPYAAPFRENFLSKDTDIVMLTPPEALLAPWTNITTQREARDDWEACAPVAVVAAMKLAELEQSTDWAAKFKEAVEEEA